MRKLVPVLLLLPVLQGCMVPIGASGDPARTTISVKYPDGTYISISNPKEVSIGRIEKTESGFILHDYKSIVSSGAVAATQSQAESNTEIIQAISTIFSIRDPKALSMLGLALQTQTASCVPTEDKAPGTDNTTEAVSQ